MAERTHEHDLPLHSNIDDIIVTHFNLDLTCNIGKKIFHGYIVLVLESVDTSVASNSEGPVLHLGQVKETLPKEDLSECMNTAGSQLDLEEEKTVIYTPDENGMETSKLESARAEVHDLVSYFKETSDSRHGFTDIVCKVGELSYHNCLGLHVENDQIRRPSLAQDFVMVLDAWDLNITSVQEIIVQNICCDMDKLGKTDKKKMKEVLDECEMKPLMFLSEKTCLKVWKPGIKQAKHFPQHIRISYQTQPGGPSLKWTCDQDGRPCVYTHGHWINNRSLFPSQDVPGALSTWRSYIHVPYDITVLMSGDHNPEVIYSEGNKNFKTYIYHTDLVVPSSTLALAAGHWIEVKIIACSKPSFSDTQLPCRLFTPKTHKCLATTLFASYVPRCMDAAYGILGPHPFKRLDILIVPASFASLGMASPSLMFLSQSVLSVDGHMLIRVAHEISHSWFGLAIGPRDWHEEWLSEGFCSYTEFVIHATANQMTYEEYVEEREIYDHMKKRVLEAEMESTSTELHSLRNASVEDYNWEADHAMKDEDCMKSDLDCVKDRNDANPDGNDVKTDSTSVKYVSNGMNPDKGFMQLHYLKGYFLLRHLEDLVGYKSFHAFLKHFVKTFHHLLIDSMDVLRLFFKTFPDVRSSTLSEETILRDWLNSPGLPKVKEPSLEHNRLVKEVCSLELKVLECNSIWTKLHWRKRRKLDLSSYLKVPKLKQSQVLLFLDRLRDMKDKIHSEVLYHLKNQLDLALSNADVRHKWCELVVQKKLEDSYGDVKDFLVHHQAMGVYLFGELVISLDRKQRKIAEDCFSRIRDDMEDGVRKVVQTMIYGS